MNIYIIFLLNNNKDQIDNKWTFIVQQLSLPFIVRNTTFEFIPLNIMYWFQIYIVSNIYSLLQYNLLTYEKIYVNRFKKIIEEIFPFPDIFVNNISNLLKIKSESFFFLLFNVIEILIKDIKHYYGNKIFIIKVLKWLVHDTLKPFRSMHLSK